MSLIVFYTMCYKLDDYKSRLETRNLTTPNQLYDDVDIRACADLTHLMAFIHTTL